MLKKVASRHQRHRRVRKKVRGTPVRPRLAVYRSNKNIYAQIIDDVAGSTLVAASSVEAGAEKRGATVDIAKAVGQRIGERAKSAGISTVVFDRGGFRYHGRIAGVADGARDAGLKF
ncbi:MAG TPA: 50S ribosomal protein L18 [Acidimicrobiia bacterium]|nr:50S ribosomal protein L18 [Acidimicrobiia bacterium]